MTCFVAVDLGRRRVGVAACDEDERVASPLRVYEGLSRRLLIDKLCVLAQERDAEFVVGLPLRTDGSEQRLSKDARAFARTLEKASERTVYLQEETWSTMEAESRAYDAGRGKTDAIDDVAAQVILEDFLSARHRQERSKNTQLDENDT